jgi:hypothetical protein
MIALIAKKGDVGLNGVELGGQFSMIMLLPILSDGML